MRALKTLHIKMICPCLWDGFLSASGAGGLLSQT